MRTLLLAAIAAASAGAASADLVSVEHCVAQAQKVLGGDATHIEFESRGGTPIFELVLKTDDALFYVGCDAITGYIAEVDRIVATDDPLWTAVAKISADDAKVTALKFYPGEHEETKALLLSTGEAVFEVDVEIENADGEFNVYVDAVTGAIHSVNIEYWEIGGAD